MISFSKQTEEFWQQDQDAEEALRAIISDRIYVNDAFHEKINSLVEKFGNNIYANLLHMLCRQNFEADKAKQHWEKILTLHYSMTEKLAGSRPIDVRLALINYFLHDEDGFEQPALIDLVFFDRMQESAYKDELTALFNYRYLKEHLDQELQRSKRYSSMVSIMMLDIDDFKYYNDHHGHEAGNLVLKKFAQILKDNIRGMDTAIRYGGEEFLLTLPATNKDGALIVYERIKEALSHISIEFAKEQPLGVISTSAGIATCPADASDADTLIQHADNAMYIAKNHGKNRVQIYGKNRRSHQRIETRLDGTYSLGHPDNQHPLTTLDISEGGLLIMTDEEIPVGALLDIRLIVQGGSPLPFPSRVIRSAINEDGRYTSGVHIVEIPSQDRIRLQNFINERANKE